MILLMIFPMLFGMGMECSGNGLDAERFPEQIKRETFHALGIWGRRLYPVWKVIVALVVPIAIVCVFLSVLGVF